MHPTTQVQVHSWTEFGCIFLLLMKNHLVPPRLDLIFQETACHVHTAQILCTVLCNHPDLTFLQSMHMSNPLTSFTV
jgi:hypothetical protein